jgi:hypothetical protein
MQREEEVLREKEVLKRMKQRGVDFLAEIELGHAPEREQIV